MGEIHRKIVDEIIKESESNDNVIAVNVLGSVARGDERPDSDVDIQLIVKTGEWKLENTKRYSIAVDVETYPEEDLIERFERYPYLCYAFLESRPVWDPSCFLQDFLPKVKQYFENHPEVVEFWKEKITMKKKLKEQGKGEGFSVKCYDDAEILFSKEHGVTRSFFKGKKVL